MADGVLVSCKMGTGQLICEVYVQTLGKDYDFCVQGSRCGKGSNMDRIQHIGYSNKVFFYQFVRRNSFTIRFRYEFCEDIDIQSMKSAIEEALNLYPEFRIQVFLEGRKIMSIVNDRPIPFFEGIGEEHELGGDETNGYLFYFEYEKRSLLISYYHGMTDTKGVLTFMGTALYLYAQKTGRTWSEDEVRELEGKIRFSEADIPEDDLERLDPYAMFVDESVEPKSLYSNPKCCYYPGPQYPEESRELNRYEIEFSLSEILHKTKEYGVSVGVLLISIFSHAFYQLDDIDKSRPIVGMLPVDLRRHFGINTLVNFSDGISVPMDTEELNVPIEEACRKFKEFMTEQICREDFIKIMTDKVRMVRSIEQGEDDFEEMMEKNIQQLHPKDFNPLSYAFTYPGNLNMGSGIDRMLSDIHYSIYARTVFVSGSSFNDCFRLGVSCRSDNGYWAEHIRDNLESLGIKTTMRALGKVRGDVCNLV